MKLRLATGELRVRLQPGEVAILDREGICTTRLTLGVPGRELVTAVALGTGGPPSIAWDGTTIRITLPRESASGWLRGEREGIRVTLDTPGGPQELRVETDRHPDSGPRGRT